MLRNMIQNLENFYRELEFLGKSSKTVETYQFSLKYFRSFCHRNRIKYKELDYRQAKAYRNFLAEKGLSPNTINGCLSALKTFYDFLVDEEIINRNPVNTAKLRVKIPETLPEFLTEDEKNKIMNYFSNQSEHVRLAFMLMLSAGLRIGECASLKPRDVFIRDNAYLVHVRGGKGAKERLAPIVDRETALEVAEYAEKNKDNKTLFGLAFHTFGYHARRCRNTTGIHFHPHRLRHTFATELLQGGVPIDVVQEALGHASIKTTRTYAKTSPMEIIKLATHL
ncbi:MAG: tyrosine-type recombinase/integrase [Clostridiales bacterium]|nr:tyrosine-type recombinase/integrase [Clostridiales bacterium]